MLRTAQGVWSCLNFSSNQIIKLKGDVAEKLQPMKRCWSEMLFDSVVLCVVLCWSPLTWTSSLQPWAGLCPSAPSVLSGTCPVAASFPSGTPGLSCTVSITRNLQSKQSKHPRAWPEIMLQTIRTTSFSVKASFVYTPQILTESLLFCMSFWGFRVQSESVFCE